MPAWAFVLCKFRSYPEEPIPADFCRKFFVQPGTGGLYDYWRDVSFGKITLDGSKILGPLTLSYDPADAAAAVTAERAAAMASGVSAPHPRLKLLQMAADDVSRTADLSTFWGTGADSQCPLRRRRGLDEAAGC